MTILITLLTLSALTFFLIGNFYNVMQHRTHNRNKMIENLQKKLHAKKLNIESTDRQASSGARAAPAEPGSHNRKHEFKGHSCCAQVFFCFW